MTESKFQKKVIDELKELLPNCMISKNDSGYIQGFPDITVLGKGGWAVLECKADRDSPKQPNQEYYVQKLNEIGFSRFIYPDNKTEVFDELLRAFKS